MPKHLLTKKQETFCLQYVKTGNATQSAITAGYSPKTAVEIASINLTKVNIISRVQELRQKAEDKTIATVIERKQVLTEIVRGRVNQFTKGNRINATVNELNSASVGEVVTSEIQIGKGDDAAIVEIVKLKLRDPVQAISELNKMEKIYSELPANSVTNNTQINIYVMDGETKDLLAKVGERTGKLIEGTKTS